MNYICDECGYVSDEPGLCPTCGVYLKKFDEEINILGTNKEDYGTASDIDFLGEEENLSEFSEEDELDEEFLEDSDDDLI